METIFNNWPFDMSHPRRRFNDFNPKTRSDLFGYIGMLISMVASVSFALAVFFLIFGMFIAAAICGGVFSLGLLVLSLMTKTIVSDDTPLKVTVPDSTP